MTAGDETKAGARRHIDECNPSRDVATVDMSGGCLIIVVRIAEARWKLKPAVIAMKVLR